MNIQTKADLPPFKPLPQKAPDIAVDRRVDGTILIASKHPLGAMHRSVPHMLEAKAAAHPERNFIGQRPTAAGRHAGRLALHHLWRGERESGCDLRARCWRGASDRMRR